jgi:hypothetical protein
MELLRSVTSQCGLRLGFSGKKLDIVQHVTAPVSLNSGFDEFDRRLNPPLIDSAAVICD